MWPNPQKTVDLVTFTKEILNGKLDFLQRKTLVPESFFHKVYKFIKKDTPAKIFSCEFCEILKNNFFTEHLPGWLHLTFLEVVQKFVKKIQAFAVEIIYECLKQTD